MLAFAGAALASVVVNPRRLEIDDAQIIKQLLFLLTFVLLFFLIVSVISSEESVTFLVKTLVIAGSVVAVFALVEAKTGFNVFNHLGVVPLLHLEWLPDIDLRGTSIRALASAQHPIALGAVLVMLIPLSAALVRVTGRGLWWIPTAVLGLGAAASVSRTTALMLLTVLIVGLVILPRETFVCGLRSFPSCC